MSHTQAGHATPLQALHCGPLESPLQPVLPSPLQQLLLPPYYTDRGPRRALLRLLRPLQRWVWQQGQANRQGKVLTSSQLQAATTKQVAQQLEPTSRSSSCSSSGSSSGSSSRQQGGVEVVQGRVAHFTQHGLVTTGGQYIPADLVLYSTKCTGYYKYLDGHIQVSHS